MDNDYSKSMGRNLRLLRRGKGLTQEELAAKVQVAGCDLTRSALAKIEVGQRHLYPDEIKALKQALSVDYDRLFV